MKKHKFCTTCQEIITSMPHPHPLVQIVDNNYNLKASISISLPINIMFAVKYQYWFETMYTELIRNFDGYDTIDIDLLDIFFDLNVEMKGILFSSELEKTLLKSDIIGTLSLYFSFSK